jgi:protein-S-isoprenylcysteine O-methyltransferase Ste14
MGFLDLFPWSWLIMGIVLGVGVFALINWLNKKNIAVRWYEWLIAFVGLVIFLFAFQNFFAAFDEWEPQAAWKFILVLGLPGLAIIAAAWQLVVSRYRAQKN